MDKAARAVRRSSAKLLGGGHSDLHLLLSEVKDMRNTAKAFANAQNAVAQDLLKWAVHEDNRALQDVINQLAELNLLWTEVQQEFGEHIKDYRHMFEMVLEGEKQVSQSKNNFVACEQREVKIRKELKKAFKKASSAEIQLLEGKLCQAERAKDLAQLEVTDRVRENEAVKLIRLKEGLMKVSQAFTDLGRKCVMVFDTQQDIVQQLPDVLDQDLEDIKYTGSGITRFKVQQAKEKVRNYHRSINAINSKMSEPPPPYSLQSYDYEYEDSQQHSTSSVYPSLSPRRRVSSSLDHSQGSPSVLDPAQQSLATATTGAPVQETTSPASCYPAPFQSTLELGLEAAPPTVLPLSFDPPRCSVPPPRPPVSPSQAGAAAAIPPPQPPPPPTACAILKTPKPNLAASNDLPPASASSTLSESLHSPNPSHHHHHQLHSNLPSQKICSDDVDKTFFYKQEHFQGQTYPTLSFTGSLPPTTHQGAKHLGDSTAENQGLEIVDFNPDWDNNFEDDLSMAVGGVNIKGDNGTL
ncbi:zinc-binding alcohol dehydrogenase domain-containing protein 2 [Elysia marginata]|uniref:Zinc-binding alcohol dehydrogenase domain-containing protein 2 n=1 Tax=Elysia marginata TaxID=1093978 RepID=A0AAV4J992_9GAST|nr:zinc-binding alcohol dehydrogenase domain-containing protein 2 [Elysia marginata]